MTVDNNDFIDLYYTIKNYTRTSNIELLENEDTYTCSEFIELCHKYIKYINKTKIDNDPDEEEEQETEKNYQNLD